ncbi:MAG: S49 family peptidase [Gammaproteobacteria bacterium]|nr:S49 family peptidase [Gammaproteobacteria bacterium]
MTGHDEESRTEGLSEDWARRALTDLAQAALTEQRRARRWSLFFRFAFLTVFVAFFVNYEMAHFRSVGLANQFTALVRLQGTIRPDSQADAGGIDAALRAAFAARPRAVILAADSPGGSPVQASDMNEEIWRLRARYPRIPIYTVVGDLCASGCYYVAVATNRIYANPASLVGSIGVLMDGFGYTGIMKKLGITRRLLTAGSNKDFLDPFSPLTAQHRAYAQNMLDQIHRQFIAAVTRGRGARLVPHADLFSGLIWTGERARQLGLIDGFGSVGYVARHIVKAPHIVDFTPKPGLAEQFAEHLGADVGHALTARVWSPLPRFL